MKPMNGRPFTVWDKQMSQSKEHTHVLLLYETENYSEDLSHKIETISEWIGNINTPGSQAQVSLYPCNL